MTLTIGERIVLLALDEKSGKLRESPVKVALAVAAAGLLEPESAAGGIVAERRREHPRETTRDLLLAVREAALDSAYQGLVEKGVVTEQGRRVLGAFGSVKHPVSDASELVALKERLDAVLVEGQEPDEVTAALVTVVHRSGLEGLLPQGDGSGERLAAITGGQAAELGDTVRGTFTSLAAVIAATTI